MGATATREAYLETGLTVLADSGYGSLKLAEVCKRLGVTTGSFYHFFKNWSAYTSQLIEHWYTSRTESEMSAARFVPDPQQRIDGLIEYGLALPHGAESAIRTWSAIDPAVRKVQEDADRARYDVVFDAVLELLDDRVIAHRYASWALYLLTGYEQTTLPRDVDALKWAARHITTDLSREVRRHRREQRAMAVEKSRADESRD